MAVRILVAFLLASPLALHAIEQQNTVAADLAVNPIRKVVTMLQNMQKKVEAEGKKEEELFEKFMCYCKGGKATLEAGIAASNKKIKELTSSIASGEGEKGQLQQDLMNARTARD